MTDLEFIQKALNSEKLDWENAIAFELGINHKQIIRVYSKEHPIDGVDFEVSKTKYIRQVTSEDDEITTSYTIRLYQVGALGRLNINDDDSIASVKGWWKYDENYKERTVSSQEADELLSNFETKYNTILSDYNERKKKEAKKAEEERMQQMREAVLGII